MKKVVFIRHAKSNQDFTGKDIHRPLMEKGIKRAEEYSDILSKSLNLNDFDWFSSPAIRAQQTSRIYQQKFPAVTEIKEIQNLYTFSFGELRDVLAELWKKSDSIVVFGHNPAFTQAVNTYGNQYISNLCTSGTVYIEGELDKDIQGESKLIITSSLKINNL